MSKNTPDKRRRLIRTSPDGLVPHFSKEKRCAVSMPSLSVSIHSAGVVDPRLALPTYSTRLLVTSVYLATYSSLGAR